MRKVLAPALAALAFHAVLLVVYVIGKGGDPAILVGVSNLRAGQAPFEEVRVGLKKNGYDGQFFYAIARNPFRKLARVDGIDCPPLRQARILYPVVSWLLTGGDPLLLIWVMPMVNLLAIGGLAALGALLADRQGFNPWWGFSLPLAVCAGLPALRDLSDIVSVTALCALLTAWLLRGPWWTLALSGAAAMFARDPNVAIVMLVLAGTTWRRDVRGSLGLMAAVVAWVGWMTTIRVMYGTWSFTAVKGDLGPPGQGIWYCLTHLSEDPRRMALVHVACLLTVFFELALAARLLFSGADRVTVLMALAGAGLVILGDVPVYESFWGYMRIFNWLPLACWLACIHSGRRIPAAVLAVSGLLPIGVVVWAFLDHGAAV